MDAIALDRQRTALERVLRQNKLAARVHSVRRAPQVALWRVRLHDLSKASVDRALGLANALELALGDGPVRVTIHDGFLEVEVPAPRRPIAARELPVGKDLQVPVGVGVRGDVFSVDFKAYPHLLVVGATGVGGKTNLLRTLAWGLARAHRICDVCLAFIDLLGSALAPMERLVHAPFRAARTPEEASAILAWLDALADVRRSQTWQTHIFLFVDEALLLTREVPASEKVLAKLAATGRNYGVHLVVATQEVNKRALGESQIARNLVARVAGRVSDAQASYWALGVRGAGAERLLGNGDMLAHLDGLERFQAARVFAADLELVPLRESWHPFPKAKLETPRPGRRPMEVQEEWLEAFRQGASVTEVMQRFGISSSLAYRVKGMVACDSGT